MKNELVEWLYIDLTLT